MINKTELLRLVKAITSECRRIKKEDINDKDSLNNRAFSITERAGVLKEYIEGSE